MDAVITTELIPMYQQFLCNYLTPEVGLSVEQSKCMVEYIQHNCPSYSNVKIKTTIDMMFLMPVFEQMINKYNHL